MLETFPFHGSDIGNFTLAKAPCFVSYSNFLIGHLRSTQSQRICPRMTLITDFYTQNTY